MKKHVTINFFSRVNKKILIRKAHEIKIILYCKTNISLSNRIKKSYIFFFKNETKHVSNDSRNNDCV